MNLAKRDILRKAAGAQNNGLLRLDEGGLARVVVRKPVSLAHFHADNASLFIGKELHQLGAHLHFDADFPGFGQLFVDQLRTGGVDRLVGPLDGVPTVKVQPCVLDAEIGFAPLQRVFGVVSNRFGQFRMVDISACPKHILQHQFGGILHAVFLLQLRPRRAKITAVDNRITAVRRHLF